MRKKTAVLIISFSAAAVLCLGILAYTGAQREKQLENYVRSASQRAFSELVADMDDLSVDLEKTLYVSDKTLQSALLTQIYGEALQARMAIGTLPYGSWQLERASGFISRVGDYACKLAENVAQAEGLTPEELNNLCALSETASVTAENMRELQMQLSNGTMVMDTQLLAAGVQSETILLSDAIGDIENEFPQLPTLIYDGPFSDGITKGEAEMLAGRDEISVSDAKTLIAQLLDMNTGSIQEAGECGGDVPLLCFTGGNYSVSLSQQGGLLWSMLCSRSVGQAQYSIEDAQQIAESFLKKVGIENVKASYHIVQNNVATFNFEYVQDGVTCYADMIKIGVALDLGVLHSYDASHYIQNHRIREFSGDIISQQEAIVAASSALEVQEVSKALIPTDGGSEIYCYELLCTGADERQCLIYINAENAKEEKILLLLQDENGTLTI